MALHVLSMHWDNIPPAILEGQRRVFEHLALPLRQWRADSVRHGKWMDEAVRRLDAGDTVVFVDIDAFPLNAAVLNRAVAAAHAGRVFGLAQTANHRENRLDIYAGPMFLAFSADTHARLGRPSLAAAPQTDAGQGLSVAARAAGVGIDLLYPTCALVPKWPLAHRGVFGIGTFYGDLDVFHLFESRQQRNVHLFEAVAADVIADRPLDFERYLQIVHDAPSAPAPERRAHPLARSLRRMSWTASVLKDRLRRS